jgi:DICT domain-containing protein
MTPDPDGAQALLTIGELARRSGLRPEVLRMWEQRYGFPVPQRLPSGHRRYAPQDVDLVAHVVRRRDAGVRLDVAVAEALGSRAPAAPSVFAELRRRHPALAPHRLRKSTLLALSWALEDEFCARADAPVLFGGFQEERYFRPSAERWRELARVARTAMVFADFPAATSGQPSDAGPLRVPLAADAPMRREWLVVCDAPDLAACLSAWELPGQSTVPDRHREFEAMWTIDPRAVRDAARVCARVAQQEGVGDAAPLLHHLAEDPGATVVDVLGATTLLNRVVAYVDRLA